MGRTAKDSGGSFTPAPVGTHLARCIKIIDIGTQHGQWNGEEKIRNQVVIFWDLPTETLTIDGQEKPFTISKFYTNSLHEKANLRHDLEAWRGKAFTEDELAGFDLEKIVGQPCLVTVIKNAEKDRTDVQSVSGLPKGMTCPPQVNPSFTFWLDESYNQQNFNMLSDGMKKLIQKSDEYKKMNGTGVVAESQVSDKEDDLPF